MSPPTVTGKDGERGYSSSNSSQVCFHCLIVKGEAIKDTDLDSDNEGNYTTTCSNSSGVKQAERLSRHAESCRDAFGGFQVLCGLNDEEGLSRAKHGSH